MITGNTALIAAFVCGVYAFAQWRYAKRHSHLNVVYSQYNAWIGLGSLGAFIFLIIALLAFCAELSQKLHDKEASQCLKLETVYPGKTLFTDHCYIELNNGIYKHYSGMDSELLTKEEVLRRQP